MKKMIFVLALLIIASPALAAKVVVEPNAATLEASATEAQFDIVYDANGAGTVRAFGLNIEVSGPNAVVDWIERAPFDNHPYRITPGNVVIADGAIGELGDVMVDGPGVTENGMTIEMGSLYEVDPPADTGSLVHVWVLGDPGTTATVNISENALRGGIVMEDGTTPGLSSTDLEIDFYGGCFPQDHPDYDEWVTVGEPNSWCYPSQCYGDADGEDEIVGHGTFTVSDNDVAILVAGYTEAYSGDPATDPWIAADFDHAEEIVGHGTFRVSDNDVSILVNYYTEATVPADCLDIP